MRSRPGTEVIDAAGWAVRAAAGLAARPVPATEEPRSGWTGRVHADLHVINGGSAGPASAAARARLERLARWARPPVTPVQLVLPGLDGDNGDAVSRAGDG